MILVSTNNIDFGKVTVNENKTVSFTVFNTNNITVNITIVSDNARFVPSPSSFALLQNSSIPINVQFTPDATGYLSGTVTVSNDDPGDLTPDLINVAGIGVSPTIDVVPPSLTFGNVAINDSKSMKVKVKNTSSDALLLVSSITQANSKFSISSTLFGISANAENELTATFSPTAAAIETGIFKIFNNSSNFPEFDVNVTGTCLVPALTLDSMLIDFGSVTLGSSKTKNLILTNTSTDDINVILTSVYTNNPQFIVSVGIVKIAQNTALDIPISFTPADTSLQTGKIFIVSNAGNFEANLSAQGLAAPNIDVSTDSINFGNVAIGTYLEKNITISNSGVISLNIVSIAVLNSTKFSVTPLFGSVNPGSFLNCVVRYSPNAKIVDQGIVRIISNDPNFSQIDVQIAGEGISSHIELSRSSIDFGDVSVGILKEENLTIQNAGYTDLIVSNFSFSPSSKFSISETLPITIHTSYDKTIKVKCLLTSIGGQSDTLKIYSNDIDSPETDVSLSANGIVPNIDVTPNTLNFSGVVVGESKTLIVTVRNLGPGTLNIVSVQPSNIRFIADLSSFEVLPEQETQLHITFLPIDESISSGTLTLVDNDPGPDIVIPISGFGGHPIVQTDVTTLNFGDVVIGNSKTKTVNVTNIGNARLDVTGTTLQPFSLDAGSFSLEAGEQRALGVIFSPTTVTNFSGGLTLTTNGGTVNITLFGTGKSAPKISVSSSSLNFGSIASNTSLVATISITNTGTEDLIYTILTPSSPYNASPLTGTINPSLFNTIAIVFRPTSTGTYSSLLVITSNDTDTPTVNVSLTGKGTVGIIQWQSFKLENIIPEEMQAIANQISGLVSTLTTILNLVKTVLDIIKVFIVDIDDLMAITLKGIQLLIEKLINDLSASGLYILWILPGDARVNLLATPNYFRGLSWHDTQKLFSKKDAWNSIKGGSKVFINKVIASFDDAGDGERPQFSENAYAGGLILAADTGDLAVIIEAISRLLNLFSIEFKACFEPPTNLNAIAGNKKIKITFSPSGLMAPGFLIFRSEISGGISIPEDPDLWPGFFAKNQYGKLLTDYTLVGVTTVTEQFMQIMKFSKSEAKSIVSQAGGYIDQLLTNINQATAMKFSFEDTTVENDKSYFYVIVTAGFTEEDATTAKSKIGSLVTSELFKKVHPDGTEESAKPSSETGVLFVGPASQEISGMARSDFEANIGGLTRCRNFRCTTFVDVKEEKTKKSPYGDPFEFNLKFAPVVSSLKVTMQVVNGSTTTNTVLTKSRVHVLGSYLTLDISDYDAGTKITIEYVYSKSVPTDSKEDFFSKVGTDGTVRLTKKPVDKTSLIVTNPTITEEPGATPHSLSSRHYTVTDEINGIVKFDNPNYTDLTIKYNYFKTNDVTLFTCVSQEFKKFYFDSEQCSQGTTLCPGYKNANCFFNTGTSCTNTEISTRGKFINGVHPENIPFNQFWNSFTCQNGMNAQRCDGYNIIDPRAGIKGTPPDWFSYTVFELFPAIKKVIEYMDEIVASLLAGTEKMSAAIKNFIDLLSAKIDNLKKMTAKIQSILDIIAHDFKGPGFYLLWIPPEKGGTAYMKTAIQNSTGGPSSGAQGYTAGVVMAYGGPSPPAIADALKILF